MTGAEPAAGNIAAFFERAAARRGSAPAIVAPDGRVVWAFDELAEVVARLAGGLADMGIGPGVRVLILEPGLRSLYPIVAAVMWAGGAVMLPPLSLPLRAALRVAGAERPRAVIAGLPFWPAALSAVELRDAPIRVTSGRWRLPGTLGTEALARHAPIGVRPVPATAEAVISFTTGSTGPPTAVVRSHGVLAAQHVAVAAMRALDDSDRDLAGLPVLVLHDLGAGITSVPAPLHVASTTYGLRVRAAIRQTCATSAAGFPHLFESAVRGATPGELGAIRSVHVGGSRVRPELLARLAAIAPRAAVTVVYGCTEAEPIAAIGADGYLTQIAACDPADGICVGRVLDGLELRLERPGASEAGQAAVGAPGRIQVRGPRVSAPAGDGGWLDTGDLGRLDQDGRLWLLGRAANAVGHVNPTEVERAVEALPWVERAAFVGMGDGPGRRGRLGVQPREWVDAALQADQRFEIEKLAVERDWPLEDVLLLRKLPVVAGAAAKVDDGRLRLVPAPVVAGRPGAAVLR